MPEVLSRKNQLVYKLASRTFWLTVSMFGGATALLLFDKIDGGTWGSVVNWVLVTYAGKSVGERLQWVRPDAD